MLSNFKMQKFQVFHQETCGHCHQMNYMIIKWKLTSNTDITIFLMLQCYKTFFELVFIHLFMVGDRWFSRRQVVLLEAGGMVVVR